MERRCPVSGQLASEGVCPLARATAPKSGKAVSLSVGSGSNSKPWQRERTTVQQGQEELAEQNFVRALKAFDGALREDPANEEAALGKVASLRSLQRPRGALRACLVFLRHRGDSQGMHALKDELLKELGADAQEVVEEAAAATSLKGGQEASGEITALEDEPSCPATQPGRLGNHKEISLCTARSTSLEREQEAEKGQVAWLETAGSADFRQARKAELLDFYRVFYRSTSSKSVSTAQYSASEKNSLSIKDGHRHMPRPEGVELPPDYKQPVGKLSQAELKTFDGRRGRLLLSVHGDLFDVSDRPDKYGREGPYSSMAGHDITWALWSGYDMDEEWDKYYDLHKVRPREERDRRFQGLMSWWAFFEQEYGDPVGRLEAYEKEWTLPAPPTVKEMCLLM